MSYLGLVIGDIKGGSAKQHCEHASPDESRAEPLQGKCHKLQNIVGPVYSVPEGGTQVTAIAIKGWHCMPLPAGTSPPDGRDHDGELHICNSGGEPGQSWTSQRKALLQGQTLGRERQRLC